MRFDDPIDRTLIAARLRALKPAAGQSADASVVVPANAQGDLWNVVRLLSDVASYAGPQALELLLVVNNHPEGQVPEEVGSCEHSVRT